MKKIRYGLIVLWLLVCSVISVEASVSIGIGLPNVSIGINLPLFPELVPLPGYPVYYAPRVDANYFFYDGMYWVYQDDDWYASSWYNGPWAFVAPEVVPLYILRIPVRYYRQPPVYFREWRPDEPPRWGRHWGHEWEQHRRGWDRWKRGSAPVRAPLPVYQRQYSGDRYPRVEQQHSLRSQSYRYQPRDKAVRQHFQQQVDQSAPAPAQRGIYEEPSVRSPRPQEQEPRRSAPHQGGEEYRRPAPEHTAPQQRGPGLQERRQQDSEQNVPGARGQERRSRENGDSQEPGRGHGQGQNRDDERGRGRDK